MKRSFPYSLESLAAVRQLAADFCSNSAINELVCGEMELALNEACTHIISHRGSSTQPDETFHVTLATVGAMLVASVSFPGKRYNFMQPTNTARAKGPAMSLFAAYVTRKMVDMVMYNYLPGNINELQLIKNL